MGLGLASCSGVALTGAQWVLSFSRRRTIYFEEQNQLSLKSIEMPTLTSVGAASDAGDHL